MTDRTSGRTTATPPADRDHAGPPAVVWIMGLSLCLLVAAALAVAVATPRAAGGGPAVETSPVRVPPTPVALQSGASLPKPTFDAGGELLRPDPSYRRWIYVGAPLTPNELNPPAAPFPEFHNVYIHPDNYDHYARTGEWPDGTFLVKELVSVGSKRAPSGNGYFMGEFIGLEVAVKDSRRFPGEPGHWAYFSFGHEYPLAGRAAAQPVSQCNVCHAANAAADWVFTQYYPVLRAAGRHGEMTGGDR